MSSSSSNQSPLAEELDDDEFEFDFEDDVDLADELDEDFAAYLSPASVKEIRFPGK